MPRTEFLGKREAAFLWDDWSFFGPQNINFPSPCPGMNVLFFRGECSVQVLSSNRTRWGLKIMQEFLETVKSIRFEWWQWGIILAALIVVKPLIDAFSTHLRTRDVIKLSKEVPTDVLKDALPLILASSPERKAAFKSLQDRKKRKTETAGVSDPTPANSGTP